MSHSSGERRKLRDVYGSHEPLPASELPLPRILTLRWPNGILRVIAVFSLGAVLAAATNPANYSGWACLGIGALGVLGILFLLLQLFVYSINRGY